MLYHIFMVHWNFSLPANTANSSFPSAPSLARPLQLVRPLAVQPLPRERIEWRDGNSAEVDGFSTNAW